jgi:pimeloyl-ACP methyl ester carboxylesterase
MNNTWTTARVRTCDKGNCEVEISYNSIGKTTDPCVLMVMGLNTQGLYWDAEFCEQIAAKGYRVIRFDNRSIGFSTKFDHMPVSPLWKGLLPAALRPAAPYSLLDMVDDAAALLDHLSIAAAHWVGVSMGGMICQVAGIHRPRRCLSLTLVMTTTGNVDPIFKPPLWVQVSFLGAPKSDSVADITNYRVDFSRRILHYGCDFDEASARIKTREAVERSRYIGLKYQLAAILTAPNREEDLTKLTMPVTVIHGRTDVLVPATNGLRLAALIPDAKFLLLDNMSHCLPAWHYERLTQEIDEVASRSRKAKY